MPSEIIFAPRDFGDAVELSEGGKLWRKRLLPFGSIDYKGRKINFDQAYLSNIATSYADKAMDQVALMLADKDNSHTLDVTRFGGEVKGVEVVGDGNDAEKDGLWATFSLADEADALLKKNPKLGVSAGLTENPNRSDGKKYPVVLGHVLATLDPRIKNLGSWTPVELSGYDADATFVDLSAEEIAPVATVAPSKAGVAELTLEQIEAMTDEEALAWLATLDGTPTIVPTPVAPVVTPAALPQKEPVMTLSVTAEERAVELANAARMRNELDAVRAQLAASKFNGLRELYVGRGVPPALVELARPLLEVADDSVINLSEDSSVNASDIVRQMLDSMAGFVQLNVEKGLQLSVTADADAPKEDPDKAMLELMKSQGF